MINAATNVSLYTVITVLVAALAAITLIVKPALKGRPALGWLGLGLVTGMPAVLLYAAGGDGPLTMILLGLLDVAAVSFVCFAIRSALDLPAIPKRLAAVALGLWALGAVLIATGLGWPFVAALPFQIGGLLIMADTVRVGFRSMRSLTEISMVVGIAINLAAFLVRLPFWPSLMDAGRAHPSLASPWLNTAMLMASTIFVPMVVLGILGREVSWLVANYRDRAERDGLTGLHHRRAFEQRVTDSTSPCGVLILADIDHFKAINDRYGHAVGDRVIVAFADLIDEARGASARVGGEEFALAMFGGSIEQGEAEAEAIRRAFHDLDLPGIDKDHFLAASFGVAEYSVGVPFAQAFARADAALYDAKARGRNQTVCATGSILTRAPVRAMSA